jgi:hypothetical protein
MLADLELRGVRAPRRRRASGQQVRFAAFRHVHEPIGKRVGLALARVTRLADSKPLHRRQGCALRLDSMRDLVRDQALTLTGSGLVGAVAKEQIWTDRERARAERLGRGIGVTTRVHANVSELRAERCLELRSQAVIERRAVPPGACDELGGIGIDLGTRGATHDGDPWGRSCGYREQMRRHVGSNGATPRCVCGARGVVRGGAERHVDMRLVVLRYRPRRPVLAVSVSGSRETKAK